MRCLQDEARAQKLHKRLENTLYSLEEFKLALEMLTNSTDPDDKAWAFYVMRNQGFAGIDSHGAGCWGKTVTSTRGMSAQSSNWWSRFEEFPHWHQRVARAQIDNQDALEVIRYWDSDETTFYLDPPYVRGTRVSDKYAHEASDEHHQQLIELILAVKGNVTISCYAHDIYKPLETAGWQRTDFEVSCAAAGRVRGSICRGEGNASLNVPRIETVYLNPKASQALGLAQTLTLDSLFE